MLNLSNLNNLGGLGIGGNTQFNPNSLPNLLFQGQGLSNNLFLNKIGVDSSRLPQGGNCVELNGTNEYVDISNTISVVRNLTKGRITGSVLANIGLVQQVIGASDESDGSSDIAIRITTGNKLQVVIRENSFIDILWESGATFADNTFHTFDVHMTATGLVVKIDKTIDSGTFSIGSSSTVAWFNDVNNLGFFAIGVGKDSGGFEFYLDGKVSNINIYDEDGTTLLLKYNQDEKSGSIAFDSSGNENHGTYINSPTHTQDSTLPAPTNQNEFGFTLSDGATYYTNNDDTGLIPVDTLIPRDESNPTKCIAYLVGGAQADLQYSGKVKMNAKLEASNCITLNGTTQYGSANDADNLDFGDSFDFTIEVNSSTNATSAFLLSQSNQSSNSPLFGLLAGSSDSAKLSFLWRNDSNVNQFSFTSLSDVFDGTDKVVRLTYDGVSKVELYIDGVLDISETNTPSGTFTATNWGVGALNRDTISNYFAGKIWGINLTVNGSILLNNPMAEGSGNTSYDKSGNGNDISWINAPTWTTQDVYHNNITNGFNKYMYFDGVNDYVYKSTNNFRSADSSGSVLIDFATTSTSAMSLWGSSDESSTNYQFYAVMVAGAIQIFSRESNVNNAVITTNTFNDGLYHTVEIISDGGNWSIKVDEVVEATTISTGTNNGNWFADVTKRNNFFVGALRRSDLIQYFDGVLANCIIKDSSGDVVFTWNGYGNANSDWEDQVGSNDGTVVGSPANIRIPKLTGADTDVLGATLRNVPVNGHNDAETTIDFRNIAEGGAVPPEMQHLASSVNFTAFTFGRDTGWDTYDYAFYRQKDSVANDRFLIYAQNLTGTDLAKAEKYTNN